VGVRTFL